MENKLENRIKAIEEWQRKKDEQQIAFPFDENSIKILSEHFMRILKPITFSGGVSGNETTIYIGKQGNLRFQVSKEEYSLYQVDVSSNVLTTNVYLDDGTNVIVLSSGTPPDPLVSGTDYYIRDSSGTSFKLAATLGGTAIDITDTGAGSQYLLVF